MSTEPNYQDQTHKNYCENRPDTGLSCKTPSKTKQSFKDDCDINKIMARFKVSGQISHLNPSAGNYGTQNALSFTEAMMTIKNGQAQFDALPSNLRAEFHYSPAEFLEFTANPDNRLAMAEMGLLNAEATSEAVAEAAAAALAQPPAPTETPPSGSEEPSEP